MADITRSTAPTPSHYMATVFRTLVLPDEVERWPLTTLREKVVKIGAKVVAHARYTLLSSGFGCRVHDSPPETKKEPGGPLVGR